MKHCLYLLTAASEVSAQHAAPAVAFSGSAVLTPLATWGRLPSVLLWCISVGQSPGSWWGQRPSPSLWQSGRGRCSGHTWVWHLQQMDCCLCPSCSQGHAAMPILDAQQCIEGRPETDPTSQHCRAELPYFPSMAPLVKRGSLSWTQKAGGASAFAASQWTKENTCPAAEQDSCSHEAALNDRGSNADFSIIDSTGFLSPFPTVWTVTSWLIKEPIFPQLEREVWSETT